MKRLLAAIGAILMLAVPVCADEPRRFVLGLGFDDVRNYREPSAKLTAEIEWGTVPRLDALRWRAGAMTMFDGDVWLGAGVSYRNPIGEGPWFFEAFFGPGFYYRDDEDPGIGHLHFPMFRSQGGFGYQFDNEWSLSFLLSHLSDGGLDVDAGSSEALVLTYSRPF